MSRKNSSRKSSVEKVRKVSNERMSPDRKSSDGRKSIEKRKMSSDIKKSARKQSVEIVEKSPRKLSSERKLSSKKDPTKYIISKKTPTQMTYKVDPAMDDSNLFVACQNTILVYSLQTGLHVRTMRAKPKDPSNKGTGDVHKANIVLLHLVDGSLISLCSQGTLASWSTHDFGVLNSSNLGLNSKIRHAKLQNDKLIVNSSKSFQIFDSKSLKKLEEIPQEIPILVTKFILQGEKLVYILGKAIVTYNLATKLTKVISRQAHLVSLDLSHDGKKLAVGDECGKIYILYNFMQTDSFAKLIIQSLPQWHAHSVNSLRFTEDGFLLSAGQESVLVQWNLENQDRTFVSRMGAGEILNLTLGVEHYCCLFSNNSVKVMRFDNNKPVIDHQNLLISDIIQSVPGSESLAFVSKSNIQFKKLVNQDGPVVSSNFVTNPRNFVANENEMKIKKVIFSQKTMVTFEELKDTKFANKQITVQNLKIWEKQEDGYQLKQFIHSPCKLHGEKMVDLKFLGNDRFLFSSGSQVQVWAKVKINLEGQKPTTKWQIIHEFDFQDQHIRQIETGINLRIHSFKKAVNEKQIALLHGQDISFWSEQTFKFTHKITLNQPCVKLIFEKSQRYFAALRETGGVEVWSIKGEHEAHQWDLNFSSISDIEVNSSRENQFFILMNSEDTSGPVLDSVLLFQFSRPQNLVNFWKLLLPISRMQFFCVKSTSFLLLTSKNGDMQKIYCGISKTELAEKKKQSLKMKEMEHAQRVKTIADNQFDGVNKTQNSAPAAYEFLPAMKFVAPKKTESAPDFLTMPSIGYTLDEFANKMLQKPSAATDIMEMLTEEMERLRVQQQQMVVPQETAQDESKIDPEFEYKRYFQ